jgi:hypothetical protein
VRAAPAETLALFPEPLPPAPRELAGFSRDDQVWLIESGRHTAGRVMVILRKSHQVIVRTEDDRTVPVNPEAERGRLLKRNLEP